MPDTPDQRKLIAAAQTLSGALLGLGLIGYILDKKLETEPYLLLTGLLLGIVVGFYDLWKAMFPRDKSS